MSRQRQDIFFNGILKKEGRPQEHSFLRKQVLPTSSRKILHCNCHFHLHHYCGFQVIVLIIPGGSVILPEYRLISDRCADRAYLPHIPAFPFSDKERSLFCPSSKHNPPTLFSLSVRPWHHGTSPYALR